MLHVVQSQRVDVLVEAMQDFWQQHPVSVFAERQVLVPSHGMGEWLRQQTSLRQGICAQMATDFVGTFQWRVMANALALLETDQADGTGLAAPVTEALLSATTLHWQLYGFLARLPFAFLTEAQHPDLENSIHINFLSENFGSSPDMAGWLALQAMMYRLWQPELTQADWQTRLWQQAGQIARVLHDYVVYRPEWLEGWAKGQTIADTMQQLQGKSSWRSRAQEASAPDWKTQHNQSIEQWQAWLWRQLFAGAYAQRQHAQQRFWAALDDPQDRQRVQQALPSQIVVFCLNRLPPAELTFLKGMARQVPVLWLHFNPSQEYWADIVDAVWLERYRPVSQGRDALYEGRHRLLSRLGKQARDVFRQLVDLAGGDYGDWEDAFVTPELPQTVTQALTPYFSQCQIGYTASESLRLAEDGAQDRTQDNAIGREGEHQSHWQDEFATAPALQFTLLQHLQREILTLNEAQPGTVVMAASDRSLQVHACHSALRQLEVLRDRLRRWLAEPGHQPSDVVVYCTQLAEIEPLIRQVFLHEENPFPPIPVQITGVPSAHASVLWQALSQRFLLLQSRFSLENVLDWLSLPPVQRSYGLDSAQCDRIATLLEQAGFRRGFDLAHVSTTLAAEDQDSRYTFRYALDRLMLGIAMPVLAEHAGQVAFPGLQREDIPLVSLLWQIYAELDSLREWCQSPSRPASDWLQLLQHHLQECFSAERDSVGWQTLMAVFQQTVKQSNQQNVQQNSQTNKQKNAQQNSGLQVNPQSSLPLPLLLSQVTENLADAPPGAVPTGKVTFARLGTLRPIPYRLVVMLGLDNGVFPQRELRVPSDLITQYAPRVGDRSRQEDEQGAFLEGLLVAREACWLFYNGFDVADSEPRLPAAPLQWLLDYVGQSLSLDSMPEGERKALETLDKLALSEQLLNARIRTHHTLLPFEQANFSAGALDTPTAALETGAGLDGIWFRLAQQFYGERRQSLELNRWLNHPLPPAEAELKVAVTQLAQDLLTPARHFLTTAGIRNLKETDVLPDHEPLGLSGLDTYAIRRRIMEDLPVNQWSQDTAEAVLAHSQQEESEGEKSGQDAGSTLVEEWQASPLGLSLRNQLPAGALYPTYQQWVKDLQDTLSGRIRSLAREYGKSGMDACREVTLRLPASDDSPECTLALSVPVEAGYEEARPPTPSEMPPVWLRASSSNFKVKSAFQYWLEHLAWQCQRGTPEQAPFERDGLTVVIYPNAVLKLPPLGASEAQASLQRWLAQWQRNTQHPQCLPLALVLDKLQIGGDSPVSSSLIAHWLEGNDRMKPPREDPDCLQHPDWQLILQGMLRPEESLDHMADLITDLLPDLEHLAVLFSTDGGLSR